MSSYIFILLSVFALMLGCNKNTTSINDQLTLAKSSKEAPNSNEVEQYAVYNAVLDTYILNKTEMLVIDNRSPACGNKDYKLSKKDARERDETLSRDIERVHEKMPYVLEETVNDYRSKKYICLKPLFNLKVKYKLFDENDSKAIYASQNKTETDKLKAFNEKYPHSNGILTLSNVGFNHEMNQALVYVGQYRHSTDGVGRYFVLTKENGMWIVQGSIDIWYS